MDATPIVTVLSGLAGLAAAVTTTIFTARNNRRQTLIRSADRRLSHLDKASASLDQLRAASRALADGDLSAEAIQNLKITSHVDTFQAAIRDLGGEPISLEMNVKDERVDQRHRARWEGALDDLDHARTILPASDTNGLQATREQVRSGEKILAAVTFLEECVRAERARMIDLTS